MCLPLGRWTMVIVRYLENYSFGIGSESHWINILIHFYWSTSLSIIPCCSATSRFSTLSVMYVFIGGVRPQDRNHRDANMDTAMENDFTSTWNYFVLRLDYRGGKTTSMWSQIQPRRCLLAHLLSRAGTNNSYSIIWQHSLCDTEAAATLYFLLTL